MKCMTKLRTSYRTLAAHLIASVSCLVTAAGCDLPTPTPDAEGGRFTAVVVNRSDFLVNALLAADTTDGTPLSWILPVAPRSWDALVIDCDLEQFTPVGALVADAVGAGESVEVSFNEAPFVRGVEFDCGSIIAIEIDNRAVENPASPITTRARIANRGTRSSETSQRPPSEQSGFVLFEFSTPTGVPATFNFGWQDADARVFQSSLTLSGNENEFGGLLLCPMSRFVLGQLDDDETPAVELLSPSDTLAPAPPFEPLAVACGSAIFARVSPSASIANEYNVLLEIEESNSQSALMFDDLRDYLVAQGIFNQPSSFLSLLPPPADGVN